MTSLDSCKTVEKVASFDNCTGSCMTYVVVELGMVGLAVRYKIEEGSYYKYYLRE